MKNILSSSLTSARMLIASLVTSGPLFWSRKGWFLKPPLRIGTRAMVLLRARWAQLAAAPAPCLCLALRPSGSSFCHQAHGRHLQRRGRTSRVKGALDGLSPNSLWYGSKLPMSSRLLRGGPLFCLCFAVFYKAQRTKGSDRARPAVYLGIDN